MIVECNYAIAVATLSDYFKSLVPAFQPMRNKTMAKPIVPGNQTVPIKPIAGKKSDLFISLFSPVVIGRSNNFDLGFLTVMFRLFEKDYSTGVFSALIS